MRSAAGIASYLLRPRSGGWLTGWPVQDPSADRDGSYGYLLPTASGRAVPTWLMLAAVHDPVSPVVDSTGDSGHPWTRTYPRL